MKVMGEKNLQQICNCFDCGENVALFTGPRSVFTSTSWYDAGLGLSQIRKGKAMGNKAALILRKKFQKYLYDLGCFIQRNPGSVLFVGLLALVTFCLGLKTATVETNFEKLWVEVGGRLGKEIEYVKQTMGEGFGNTNQLIIQTPKNDKSNILHPNALLLHMEAIKVGTQVTVDMFEITWRLKDVCYSLNIPAFEEQIVDEALEKLIPCAIITPLDCFWEGSKLLGPDHAVKIPILNSNLTWTNFNPQVLLSMAKSIKDFSDLGSGNRFPFETFDNLMKRGGITTAYQKKPCLNPKDADCPSLAPNKNGRTPDIGSELTGGCYGFATKWMHWPEELIVGGIMKNKTGHIIKANAFQSIIQLMGELDMYTFWKNDYKVHNIEWSVEKARMVLEAWQRKFTHQVKQYVKEHSTKDYQIDQFTNVALLDIMKNFSKLNVPNILIAYSLMLIYAAIALSSSQNYVDSQSFLGVLGVLLVVLATASGLGLCSLAGLPFNASTTQIIPFLALGLGVNTLFLLGHTYAENIKKNVHAKDITAESLRQIGYTILLNSFCLSCAFAAAAIIPIQALRYFVAQTAILILFTTLCVLILFPALESLDLRRRRAKRMDIFCCFKLNSDPNSIKNVEYKKNVSVKKPSASLHQSFKNDSLKSNSKSLINIDKEEKSCIQPFITSSSSFSCSSNKVNSKVPDCLNHLENKTNHEQNITNKSHRTFLDKMTIDYFVTHFYIPILMKKPVKVLVIFICFIFLLLCLSGFTQIKDGLELTDIVPRKTSGYQFLSTQKRFFNVFNIFAVTRGNFEYPNNQKLLMEYHNAFTRVSKIIKNDDGGLPDSWLTMFRDWLIGLQNAFDNDRKRGTITQERWFDNASADGILAYKLLVQTGRVDNPVDKSLVTKIRLVDENGIINPKAFYNYLTAWTSNDALAYSASQANFHPEPRPWLHVANDYELKIPKSSPLVYAQIPFYLNNMDSTEEITNTIKEVRSVCENFELKGLPNFPTGLPFTYWEQYIRLRLFLLSSLVVIFAIIFLVVCIILFNPWAASLLVIVLAVTNIQLFGLMGLFDIRLSAVPAVILIISVGKGNNILIHLLMSFLTSIGKKNHRTAVAIQHMFAPLIHGEISTLLGVFMLAFSEFDFIIKYFFYVFCGVIIISSWNGLVLFPVLLSLVGPSAEVIPLEYENRISTPSPMLSTNLKKHRTSSNLKRGFPRVIQLSDISLSTISEEAQSCQSSREIIVQPELVVETTTVTNTTPHQQISTQTTSSNLTNDKLSSESSASSSDRDTPESVLSRESSAFNSDSGASSLSRSSSSTTSSTIYPQGQIHPFQQQTVTTKVTTTAKLKVEVHAPYREKDHTNRIRSKELHRKINRKNFN